MIPYIVNNNVANVIVANINNVVSIYNVANIYEHLF